MADPGQPLCVVFAQERIQEIQTKIGREMISRPIMALANPAPNESALKLIAEAARLAIFIEEIEKLRKEFT